MLLQKSRDHQYIPSAGIMSTSMVGGRPKVPGQDQRDWKVYYVCLCPNAKHQPPPRDWMDHLDEFGNPEEQPQWCTFCPLNMFKCQQDLLPQSQQGRSFPRWLHSSHQFGAKDIGKTSLIPLAQKWVNCQGGNPDGLTFCANSGRKTLGKWCSELRIPYPISFEVHGDLWSTWSKYYQRNLRREYTFDRDQAPNVDDATQCLWRFARYVGRGKVDSMDPIECNLAQLTQMSMCIMRGMNMQKQLDEILRN